MGKDKTATLTLFQTRVKELVEQKGYTPEDLANYAGISIESAKRYAEDISYTEDTSSEPTIRIARSIAQALDTDLDYLLGLWDEETLFSRPQRADELLINLFKAVAIVYPAIHWYADAYSKRAVISPDHEYLAIFFERINLNCDEIEIRSIISDFVLELEEKNNNTSESKVTTKKRNLADVEEVSDLSGFGVRLNQFMINENLTPSQLSERTGIPYETVSSYFKKKSTMPRINNAMRFAKTFGVGLDFLLGISEDRLLINEYSAAKGVFINLYKMLQYANFKLQQNPDSGDMEAVSNNRLIYYFFHRIHSLNTMDDVDQVTKEADKFCLDYKLEVSESGEIMLYDEYMDHQNSKVLNQIRKTNAIRAALEYNERENKE